MTRQHLSGLHYLFIHACFLGAIRLFLCATEHWKAFIIAGESSGQSSSKVIGFFAASLISSFCSAVNGFNSSSVTVLVIIKSPNTYIILSFARKINTYFLVTHFLENLFQNPYSITLREKFHKTFLEKSLLFD